jgi:hypothetical protein
MLNLLDRQRNEDIKNKLIILSKYKNIEKTGLTLSRELRDNYVLLLIERETFKALEG